MTSQVQASVQARSAVNTRLRRGGLSPWAFLLLGILPLLSFLLHFRGRMVLGWDSEPPMRPDFLLQHALSAWDGRAYFGQANPFQLTGAVPIGLFYAAIYHLGGLAVADKLTLGVLFVLPAFTAFWFARTIGLRHATAVCVGFCYALSPLLFLRYYVPLFNIQLIYAMLPAIAAAWIQLLTQKRIGPALLALVAIEVATISGGINIAFWIVPHVFCGLLSLVWLLYRSKNWRVWLSRVSLGVAVVVCMNAFWLFPQVVFGLASGHDLATQQINKSYSAGARQDLAENSSLSYTLRLQSKTQTTGGDEYGPYWTYAGILKNPLVSAFYFLWLGFAMLAVLKRIRDWRVIALGVALVCSLYIMKGESPPLQQPLDAIYRLMLVGTIFRDGFDKVAPVAALALAVLVPLGIASALAFIGRRYERYALGGLVALLLLGSFPYWTGQMFMARPHGPSLSVAPPARTLNYFRSLDLIKGRILFTPSSDNALLLSTTWGFFGPNIYGRMTTAPFIAMPSSTLNGAATNEIAQAIYGAIRTRNASAFLHYARLGGVADVLVAGDMDAKYYGGETPARVLAFLASVPGVHRASVVGPYQLWSLPWTAERPGALARTDIASYDTALDAAVYLVSLCGSQPISLLTGLPNASCRIAQGAGGPLHAVVYPSRVRTTWTLTHNTLDAKTEEADQRNVSIYNARVTSAMLAVLIDGRDLVFPGTSRVAVEPGSLHSVASVQIDGIQTTLPMRNPVVVSGPPGELVQGRPGLSFSGSQELATYFQVHLTGPSVIGLETHANLRHASYSVAVVDHSTQQIVGARDGFQGARSLTVVRIPRSGDYDIYIYYHPSGEDAVLHVATASIRQVIHVGMAAFRIPKMMTLPPLTHSKYTVRPADSGRVPKFDGKHIVPDAHETVLTQNYQYDKLWLALLWRKGHYPAVLHHVKVDGFKNGWIVPAGVAGSVSVFYANNVVAAMGLLLAAVCVAAGVLIFIRERKARNV